MFLSNSISLLLSNLINASQSLCIMICRMRRHICTKLSIYLYPTLRYFRCHHVRALSYTSPCFLGLHNLPTKYCNDLVNPLQNPHTAYPITNRFEVCKIHPRDKQRADIEGMLENITEISKMRKKIGQNRKELIKRSGRPKRALEPE